MAASLNTNGVAYGDASQQNTAFIGGKGQVFTSSGTFTVPTGITAVKVTVIGGGGGGGGYSSGTTIVATAGGGGGGVAVKFITGLTPGGTVSVTVGTGGAGGTSGTGTAGGTSSFGASASATGGAGGAGNNTGAPTANSSGGAGSSGDINITGGRGLGFSSLVNVTCVDFRVSGAGGGSLGQDSSIQVALSGYVGSTALAPSGGAGYVGGAGGLGVISPAGVTLGAVGNAATGYGNGGSGGIRSYGGTASSAVGGAGSAGIVIVEW